MEDIFDLVEEVELICPENADEVDIEEECKDCKRQKPPLDRADDCSHLIELQIAKREIEKDH